ncbi:hypothetical protein SUGI_0422510 [Cryptomeria japonica]|nr:hypothetical protein SUGI_0422510 [Cryptomeria japonica]
MDCNPCESGESKLKVSSIGVPPMVQQSQRIAPIIRIVHIVPPKVFKTDPANFGALVQKLTGKHSTHLSRQSFKKSKYKKMAPIISHRRSDSSEHTMVSLLGQDEFPADHFSGLNQPLPKKSVSYEDQFVATSAQVKSESVEDSLMWCDNFSGLFGEFDELDILATQMHSDSILPEFLADQIPTVSFKEVLRG